MQHYHYTFMQKMARSSSQPHHPHRLIGLSGFRLPLTYLLTGYQLQQPIRPQHNPKIECSGEKSF